MGTTVNKLLDIARAEIGTKATAVKKCKYNTWFYGSAVSGSAYDWCEVFVQWCFAKAGASDLLYTKTAGCGVGASAFNQKGRFHKSGFKAGDVVYFHWSNEMSSSVLGAYTLDHVGIIEKVNNDGTVTTIEGNTGNTANGEVMRRVRSLSCISGVGRPNYTNSSSSTTDTTTNPSTSVTTPSVYYKVKTNKHNWLPEVKNATDYAGIVGESITDVAIKVSDGVVKYRVHIKGGSWLPYVTGYNTADNNNGYAGNGKTIDAIEIYYTTPSSLKNKLGHYLKAKYKVSPIRGNYYSNQYDNETTNGQDGFAGCKGVAIDRLQITLAK